MDMPAATALGRNWGAAFESIGQTVGQAVEKHRENKKAKKKERDFIDSFEARISRSPEFAKSLGLNPDDSVEVRLAGKTYFNNPEARQLSEDFSRFQRDAESARMNAQLERQRRQQMRGSRQDRRREDELRDEQRSLFEGLLASPGEQLTPKGIALTRELEDFEQAVPTLIDSMRAAGMPPEQLAKIEQEQASKIASFRDRLAFDPSMRSPLPSPAEQMFPGRPQVQRFLRDAVEEEQNPELAFGMAAKMAAALPSREAGLLYGRGGPAGTGQQPYFFSESEANKAYNQLAASQGITPTKEGRDAWTGQQDIKDLEKIRSAAVRTVKRFQLDTAKDVIGTSERLEKMILDIERDPDTGAVISGGVKTLVARLFEPVGILTEEDKNQYAGAGGLKAKAAQTWEDLMTGTLGEEQIDAIRAAVLVLEEDAKETLREDGEKAVRSVANGYNISLQDAVSRTALVEYLLSPAPGGAAPTTTPTVPPGWTKIPGSNIRFKKN
jgi:hypothetical protein